MQIKACSILSCSILFLYIEPEIMEMTVCQFWARLKHFFFLCTKRASTPSPTLFCPSLFLTLPKIIWIPILLCTIYWVWKKYFKKNSLVTVHYFSHLFSGYIMCALKKIGQNALGRCYAQNKGMSAFRRWRSKRVYQGNLQLINLNSL